MLRLARSRGIRRLARVSKTGHPRISSPEAWLDEHGDALYRYACLRVRDTSVAEDLVQETLLAAFATPNRFAGRAAERTWLISILKNKITDHLRRVAREQPLDDELAEDEAITELFQRNGHWQTPPSKWGEPHAALEQKQFWRVFSECLAALAPRQAQAFTLIEWDGATSEEVCKVLNLSPSNLWVLLHRARARIRLCLEHQWFAGPEKP